MLAELQLNLARHIRDTNVDLSQEPTSKDMFFSYTQDELQARLAIHRNNYCASLIDVLKESFPTILKLVGDDFLNMMCREYIQSDAPASPVCITYGSSLPKFLTTVRGF